MIKGNERTKKNKESVHEKKSIVIEFPCQCAQKWKQIDYNQLKMDYNITIFRGNKILLSSIIIDFFFHFCGHWQWN